MRTVDYIVVHTAGAYDFAKRRVVHQSTATIRDYHRQHNGWRDIGYHWVIEEDGALVPGRPEEQLGAHVGGFNDHTIGVCVTGHGDFEPFNPAQTATLMRVCSRICGERKLKGPAVIGHREAPLYGAPSTHKTCPGVMVDMNEIRRLITARLETT